MTTERTAATATRSRTIPLGPCLTILFVEATVLAAWVLIRPLYTPAHSPLASLGYYHPPAAFTSTYAFNRAANLLFIPYGLALVAWWKGQRVAFRWILGGAILLHLMLVLAPPPGTARPELMRANFTRSLVAAGLAPSRTAAAPLTIPAENDVPLP